MPVLIGTDEAGYGPSLGPLVVSATAWRIPEGITCRSLYGSLARVITQRHEESPDPRLLIADSKQVYRAGSGLSRLERGVLAAWCASGQSLPATWRRVWKAVAAADSHAWANIPWYRHYDEPLPLAGSGADELLAAGQFLRDGLHRAEVSLLCMRAAAVSAADLNGLLQEYENKSTLLSKLTLKLVHDSIVRYQDARIFVLCDKHGGRAKYGPLLQSLFPETLVQIYGESRAQSVYRVRTPRQEIEFRFQARAEAFLPVALASMTSKYLRELAMRAFNDFWRQQISDLRPTAGYTTDARRFAAAIAATQEKLRISDFVLWRNR